MTGRDLELWGAKEFGYFLLALLLTGMTIGITIGVAVMLHLYH